MSQRSLNKLAIYKNWPPFDDPTINMQTPVFEQDGQY